MLAVMPAALDRPRRLGSGKTSRGDVGKCLGESAGACSGLYVRPGGVGWEGLSGHPLPVAPLLRQALGERRRRLGAIRQHGPGCRSLGAHSGQTYLSILGNRPQAMLPLIERIGMYAQALGQAALAELDGLAMADHISRSQA